MMELRDYQRESVDAVHAHFDLSDDGVLIVHPTGSGMRHVVGELCATGGGQAMNFANAGMFRPSLPSGPAKGFAKIARKVFSERSRYD